MRPSYCSDGDADDDDHLGMLLMMMMAMAIYHGWGLSPGGPGELHFYFH